MLGEKFTTDKKCKEQKIYLQPILDDRMFVQSYYFNDKIIDDCSIYDDEKETYSFINNDNWYKYIFVDFANVTCRSKNLMKSELQKATYDRWVGKDGQLFGFSNYSFVGLSNRNWFTENIVSQHFRNMYFELTLLCLIQRSYILNFANAISHIANNLDKDKRKLESVKKEIAKLHLQFIKFTNRVYFKEVTPQQQGIEIYNMLQSQMQIKEEYQRISDEMKDLVSYLEIAEQSNLNKVATILLPLTLLAGLLGMNTVNDSNNYLYITISVLVALFSTVAIVYFIIIYLIPKLKSRNL